MPTILNKEGTIIRGFPYIIKRYGLIALLIVLPCLSQAQNVEKRPVLTSLLKCGGGILKASYTDGNSAAGASGPASTPSCAQKHSASCVVCRWRKAKSLSERIGPAPGKVETASVKYFANLK